ncbi:MAG: endolytic transglycosylase MltG [Candidatus Aminicenantes bacterium]|nr:endolytic transglycosylase MltG [Candidatus Aminicenantes bacterium]
MLLKTIKIVLVVAAVIPLFLSAWFSFEFYFAPKTSPKEIFFVVDKGQGVHDIAQNLKEKRVIKNKQSFLLGYKIYYSSKSLKAGEYMFNLPMSPKDILKIITDGKVYLHSLTIHEGLTRKEIARHLASLHFTDEEEFLAASSKTDTISSLDKEALSLEGYLFPETYHFPKGISAKKIISTLVSQFKEVFSEEWQKRAREIKMTPREVVILASLIEKETSLSEEKELVSAVFHNRLRIRMKLDCDPTIIYVLKEEGSFKGRLLKKDLRLNSPYNTYRNRGLPPGPICSPGRESLEAALYPAQEKYLYFVSKKDGSHHFSISFKEHQNAVRKYRKIGNK